MVLIHKIINLTKAQKNSKKSHSKNPFYEPFQPGLGNDSVFLYEPFLVFSTKFFF